MLTKADIKIIKNLLRDALKDRPTRNEMIQFKDEILGEIKGLRDKVHSSAPC